MVLHITELSGVHISSNRRDCDYCLGQRRALVSNRLRKNCANMCIIHFNQYVGALIQYG